MAIEKEYLIAGSVFVSLRRSLVCASLALLCACTNVNTGAIPHGIFPEVKGTQTTV